mmetsp:Transcript_48/g.79  ORF Transcript_48/g.79 Transcript_48/m.79 type:complete len:222 (-) Transcript_48:26-691(-)
MHRIHHLRRRARLHLTRVHHLRVLAWLHLRVVHGYAIPHVGIGLGHRCWGSHDTLLLQIVVRNNIHQKVKNVRFRDGGRNIVTLQGSPLVLLGMAPGPQRQLQNKHLARLGEHHGRLRSNHANLLVGLHDLLDAGQRKHVVIEIVSGLDLLRLLLPENLKLLTLLVVPVLMLRLSSGGSLLGRCCNLLRRSLGRLPHTRIPWHLSRVHHLPWVELTTHLVL